MSLDCVCVCYLGDRVCVCKYFVCVIFLAVRCVSLVVVIQPGVCVWESVMCVSCVCDCRMRVYGCRLRLSLLG